MKIPEEIAESGGTVKLIYLYVAEAGSATSDQLSEALELPKMTVLALMGTMVEKLEVLEKVEPSSDYRVTVA